MQIIEKLSDMIEEEMDDAEKYIQCAIKHKEDNKALAETFYKLSMEEMQHMNLLHAQVVTIIEEWRKQHGDPPDRMQAVYDYLHKKHIQRTIDIKALQVTLSKHQSLLMYIDERGVMLWTWAAITHWISIAPGKRGASEWN